MPWQWRGKSLPPRAVEALRRLYALLESGELASELSQWLSSGELAAMRIRVESCSNTACIRTRRRTGPPFPGRPTDVRSES